MHFHGAGDGADGAGADAEFARGVDGGAAELGMRGEAEIIIRAEVDDFLAVEDGDGLLLAFENLHAEIEMLGFQVFERVVEILELRASGHYRLTVAIVPPHEGASGWKRVNIIGQPKGLREDSKVDLRAAQFALDGIHQSICWIADGILFTRQCGNTKGKCGDKLHRTSMRTELQGLKPNT